MRLLHPIRLLTLALFLSLPGILQAAGLRLAVPPFLPQAEMQANYSKMTDYLSQALGMPVELVTHGSYLAYWDTMRKGAGYELVFDNAPMIGYLVRRQNYSVLAKITGVISLSLVSRGDDPILDPEELVGKPVAAIPSPNLSALMLYEMFPNPLRQPDFRFADDARAAIEMLLAGKVEAALVPTPIVLLFQDLNIVTSSRQLPHLALAAAPNVPPELRARIREAMLFADKTPAGRAMLEMLNTEGFEAAGNELYTEHAEMLKGTWGY